jgi:hypothetical protein
MIIWLDEPYQGAGGAGRSGGRDGQARAVETSASARPVRTGWSAAMRSQRRTTCSWVDGVHQLQVNSIATTSTTGRPRERDRGPHADPLGPRSDVGCNDRSWILIETSTFCFVSRESRITAPRLLPIRIAPLATDGSHDRESSDRMRTWRAARAAMGWPKARSRGNRPSESRLCRRALPSVSNRTPWI